MLGEDFVGAIQDVLRDPINRKSHIGNVFIGFMARIFNAPNWTCFFITFLINLLADKFFSLFLLLILYPLLFGFLCVLQLLGDRLRLV